MSQSYMENVHRSSINGCQVLCLVADSDLGYCPSIECDASCSCPATDLNGQGTQLFCTYTGSPDVTNMVYYCEYGLVRFPSLPYTRCPTESNFQMDGSLAQDHNVGFCPSEGECNTTSRTVPSPGTVPPRLWLLHRLCLLHRLWLLHRLLRPPQRQTVLALLPLPRIQQDTWCYHPLGSVVSSVLSHYGLSE